MNVSTGEYLSTTVDIYAPQDCDNKTYLANVSTGEYLHEHHYGYMHHKTVSVMTNLMYLANVSIGEYLHELHYECM